MITNLPPPQYPDRGPPGPPSLGPFSCAFTGIVICVILQLACSLGMEINNRTTLGILIPGMFTSCLLLFVSMGWIFLLFGRTNTRPRWLMATGIAIFICMLQMLALTYTAGQAH